MVFDEQHCIEFVKLHLLPFINSKESERVEAFEDLYLKGIGFVSRWKQVFEDQNFLDQERKKKDYLIKINQLHSFFYKMLSIALIDDAFEKYYPEKLKDLDSFDDMTDFEKSLKESVEIAIKSSAYQWRGKGSCYTLPFLSSEHPVFDEVKSVTISILLDLFKSEVYDIEPDEKTFNYSFAIGYTFFAVCPKCGKFFYRKRKDQVYCSDKCRIADGVSRFRRRKPIE